MTAPPLTRDVKVFACSQCGTLHTPAQRHGPGPVRDAPGAGRAAGQGV